MSVQMTTFATIFIRNKTMSSQRDYTSYAPLITLLVVVVLIGLSFLPRFKVGGVTIKRTNIISDLIQQEEDPELLEADPYFDSTFLNEAAAMKVIDSATRNANHDTLNLPEPTSEEWQIATSTETDDQANLLLSAPIQLNRSRVAIESFSDEAMERINQALNHKKRGPVRIAVLGDSFIEGDIFTADLREQLQNLLGGRGVGFVPFATPMSKFRASVLHTYSNWNIYNIRNRAEVPSAYKKSFFVSGMVCVPNEGATTRLEGVTFRKHLNQASVARLIFVNRNNTRINVVVNDSVSRIFTPESSEHIQQIVIKAPIHSIKVTLTHTQGFTGYGIVLEGRGGVSVDNYSIRGNSGMALFETNSFVNQQINRMRGYDLVILQYGLNVMTADVLSYNSYAKTLAHIIRYTQQCFPGASILVMGVGDRSKMQNGQFVTMPSVHGMIKAQRKAAEETGVAFWNTFEAMGGENSMVAFVEKKWASQDHTHIRYPGGKFIAKELTAALIENANANGSISDAERLPFLHDLESGYDPSPSEEGWQHGDLLLHQERSDQTQVAPSPRQEGEKEEEAAENETTEQLAIPDTLLKEQPTELETSNAPAAIADTSTVQSTAKNDTLYPKNEEQKTSDNHAAHKHKDTLTGTEQPRHTHKEKATQETENRSKSHNRALQEKSRAPRHESQSDGTQTTKL